MDDVPSLELLCPHDQVLCQVYTDSRNVDDDLVESIRLPSMHPNAAEVR